MSNTLETSKGMSVSYLFSKHVVSLVHKRKIGLEIAFQCTKTCEQMRAHTRMYSTIKTRGRMYKFVQKCLYF